MRAHIAAITALIEALDYDVYFVDATRYDEQGHELPLQYPYVLLWTSAGRPGDEVALSDEQTDIDTPLGVTAAALSPDGVLSVLKRVREVLSPSGQSADLPVTGRRASTRLDSSQEVRTDQQVVLPGGRRPSFGVDVYQLRSTPA